MVIGPTWSASDRSYRARCRISCAASSCIDLETDRAAFHVQRASRASESAYGRDGLPVHAWIPRGTQSFVGDGTSRCESPRKKSAGTARIAARGAAAPEENFGRDDGPVASFPARGCNFRRRVHETKWQADRAGSNPLVTSAPFWAQHANLKYEWCQQPPRRSCEEGHKPIPRCPIITLHRPAPKSAHRNDRAGKGVAIVDAFVTPTKRL